MIPLRTIAFLTLAACGARGAQGGLAAIHADVERALPGVAHVTADEVARLDGPLLVDVRTPEEYAVSRLPGAVRADPDVTAQAFLAEHGAALGGRDVVFYCSVGWRSSKLADRVGAAVEARGGRAANLAGGAFGWTNAGRALEGADGPTRRVHGYDAAWAGLIADEDARVLP